MFSLLRKWEVWVFLALILLANAVFVTGITQDILPKGLYGYGRFALLGAVLFGSVFLLRGFKGVWDILRPMLEWKRSPLLYLFAVSWTVLLCLLVLTIKGFVTGETLDLESVKAGLQKTTEPKLLVTLMISSFIGEIVWVSYAVRKLSEKFTPYCSALIVGVVWTLWWLPMAIYNFGIIPNLPLGALLLNQMGIAAMCAFVYHHTRSGLLVLVMQFIFNATILVFPVTPDAGGPETYWAFATTYFSAALGLFLIFGPKPLFLRRTGPLASPSQSPSQSQSQSRE